MQHFKAGAMIRRRGRHCHAVLAFLLIGPLCCLLLACSDGASSSQISASRPLLGPYSFTPIPSAYAHTGKLVLAGLQFPSAVNPLFASSPSDFTLDNALWARPVFYDQQFHVHPDQLTEVPLPENGGVQDQGKTIVMHLRHDLRWSDGQPIVASDFQYWWRLNQDADTGATLTSGYDQIANIETPDNFTVILHMKRPFGPYLFYLPYAAPQHVWGKLRPIDLQNTPSVYQNPQVTSGPYKLLNLLDGQRYTLGPNTDYTSTTFHGPFLAQLVYQSYGSVTELIQAVQRGEVDVSQGYMENDLPALSHLPSNLNVLRVATAAYEHLDLNNASPQLRDLNVRQAIQQSLDICGIIKAVLHMPDCARRATQVEPAPSLYHDATIQPSVYDPASARKLFAQAGWLPDTQGKLRKAGQAFTLRLVTTSDQPLRAAVAQAIQHDLQAVGIAVQISYYPLSTFFGVYTRGGILATGAYDMALFTYANSPEPDDEYAVFHSSQIPDSVHPDLGNYGRVNDPIIDQALQQGRDAVSFPDRVAAYHHFLHRLAEQAYVIPLYTEINIMVVAIRVQNVLPHPDQVANLWNSADWWVSTTGH
jgi:peptide/nickel transport system substrate-binding protein